MPNGVDKGFFDRILDGMHPIVRAIMFSVLAFPIVIALSAMIMNVNIGHVVQQWLELELKRKELLLSKCQPEEA